MKQFTRALLILISSGMLVFSTVHADPNKGESGQGRGPGKGKYEKQRGGPPPWAPAHGYRDKHYRDYGLTAVPIDIVTGRCNREVMGQVLGAATGGYVGSKVGGNETERLIAVAAGTFAGMVIGGEIGRSIDRSDQLCVDQALEHAPDGNRIVWNDNNRQYAVTPQETYQDRDGRYCREYQMVSDIDGRSQQVYGTACRQEDGSWQLNP